MKKLLAIPGFVMLALAILPATLFAQKHRHADTDPFTGLDTAFTRVLKDWRVAGFAVAIVDKDSVVYAFSQTENSRRSGNPEPTAG